MSVEGDFASLTAERLEEIRATPAEAYDLVLGGVGCVGHLDIERSYRGLAILMEADGFPVNPITGGTPFPDDRHNWGTTIESRSLTVAEVARAADTLLATPYSQLERHRYPLALGEEFSRPIDEDFLDSRLTRLGQFYPLLAAFFADTAERGLCTIFWTA